MFNSKLLVCYWLTLALKLAQAPQAGYIIRQLTQEKKFFFRTFHYPRWVESRGFFFDTIDVYISYFISWEICRHLLWHLLYQRKKQWLILPLGSLYSITAVVDKKIHLTFRVVFRNNISTVCWQIYIYISSWLSRKPGYMCKPRHHQLVHVQVQTLEILSVSTIYQRYMNSYQRYVNSYQKYMNSYQRYIYIYWLVVLTILKNMSSSMGRMTSQIWNGK